MLDEIETLRRIKEIGRSARMRAPLSLQDWKNAVVRMEREAEEALSTQVPLASAVDGLEALRALSEAATPGEWKATGRYIGTANHMSCVGEVCDQNGNWSNTSKSTGDAAFITSAINYVRNLLYVSIV